VEANHNDTIITHKSVEFAHYFCIVILLIYYSNYFIILPFAMPTASRIIVPLVDDLPVGSEKNCVPSTVPSRKQDRL
jgi:hypothetical protein